MAAERYSIAAFGFSDRHEFQVWMSDCQIEHLIDSGGVTLSPNVFAATGLGLLGIEVDRDVGLGLTPLRMISR